MASVQTQYFSDNQPCSPVELPHCNAPVRDDFNFLAAYGGDNLSYKLHCIKMANIVCLTL